MLSCPCSFSGNTKICVGCLKYKSTEKKILKIIETVEYYDEYGKVIKRVIEEIQ